jgi:antitoxin CptB
VSERDRVRWHCRRGMLELDLVLIRFLERHFENLTQDQHAAFKTLLEYSDNDLWDVVSGHAEPAQPDADVLNVIGLLRDV